MRVKCVDVKDASGQRIDTSPWLTRGREYVVLSIHIPLGHEPQIQILTDDGPESRFDLSWFELSDARIPSTWVANVLPGGSLEFAPKAWTAPYFWEHYYDSDGSVRTAGEERTSVGPVFEREVRLVLLEDQDRAGKPD